jgi:hypothetical protein
VKAGSVHNAMLWIAFIVLLGIWIVALLTSFTLGGFIHLILVIALTTLLAQFLNMRRIV